MAHTQRKRRTPNPNKLRELDIVSATEDFTGRTTPAPGLGSRTTSPSSFSIPRGALGILHGRAEGAPDLFDVEFDLGDGDFRRVEASPQQIAYHG